MPGPRSGHRRGKVETAVAIGRGMPSAVAKTPARKPAATTSKPAAAKPGGAAAVRTWIAAVKDEHRPIVDRFDRLITDMVSGLQKAIKWRALFYGVAGRGWIVVINSFKDYVSVGFFAGTELKPAPPLGDRGRMRRFQIHSEAEFDQKRLRSWIQQAAKLEGWGKV